MSSLRRRLGLAQGLLLLLCAFGPPRLGDRASLPDFEVQKAQLHAVKQSRMPPLKAKAAVLIDFSSDRVLFDKAMHQKLPPASTTKMMTALLTIEQNQLDSVATVSALAAGQEGTRMDIAAGQQFTVRELLYGLLLPSGNDAAVALAQQDGPSVAGFVDRMNAKAKDIGLADTHFVNPHGLDDPNHLSSAYDLSQLARYALQTEPLFDQYVATQHDTIPATPTHPVFNLTNLNQLLGSYPGADGVKTGTTPAAGEVLVGAATRNGHRLLSVVMGSTDRYADSRAVLDNGFGNYQWLTTDKFFPYPLPVAVQHVPDTILPGWEAGQVQAFVDLDAMKATFSLAGRELLSAPLGPAS